MPSRESRFLDGRPDIYVRILADPPHRAARDRTTSQSTKRHPDGHHLSAARPVPKASIASQRYSPGRVVRSLSLLVRGRVSRSWL
jgi:hypothetical protein